MASSSISVYQQSATKLLSRRNLVLGIPLAAASIILFLQWRKRKSLKPRPKPKKAARADKKEENSSASNGSTHKAASEEKAEGKKSTASETVPASAQNGSATAAAAHTVVTAAPPHPAAAEKAEAAIAAAAANSKSSDPSSTPRISLADADEASSAAAPAHAAPVPESPDEARRSKHTHVRPVSPHDDEDQNTPFAYAKRPRLGRGRSSEKFESYAPLRRTSAEKLEEERKKREEASAAADASSAFAAVAATAAAASAVVSEPAAEELAPEAPAPEEPAAPEVPAPDVAPETSLPAPIAPASEPFDFEFKVNGDTQDGDWSTLRDLRRSSIVATFEIERTVEPVGLGPLSDFSRRPSVITTISATATPPIPEEPEDPEGSFFPPIPPIPNGLPSPNGLPAYLQDKPRQASVSTTIEVSESSEPASAHAGVAFTSTTIEGPVSASREPGPAPIGEPAPAALDAPADFPQREDPLRVLVEKALANGSVSNGFIPEEEDDEEAIEGSAAATRFDSPLFSKPVYAAAPSVPEPVAAAVVGEIVDEEEAQHEVAEPAPLAHLPGMGIPNA